MTLHSVKTIHFRCFTAVRRPSYSMTHWKFCIGQLGSKNASFLQSSAYRPFKVIQGRKRVLYFLLVRHSNQGLVISDILQVFGWKLQMFLILLSCGAPLRMFYSELRGEVYHEETRVMESAVKTRSLSHFDTTPACDRQADRRTDGFTIAHMASCWRAVKSITYVIMWPILVQSNSLFVTL